MNWSSGLGWGGGTEGGGWNRQAVTGGGGTTLNNLSLSSSSIAENSAAATVVGSILSTTAGSTLSIQSQTNANWFAISGSNLVVGSTSPDYETNASPTVTIRETLAGATNTPRDTVLSVTVTDVAEGGGAPTVSNYAYYTEDLDSVSWWTRTNVTATSRADGASLTNANGVVLSKVTETATTGLHYITYGASLPGTGAQAVWSADFKGGSGVTNVILSVTGVAGAFMGNVTFNPNTGVIVDLDIFTGNSGVISLGSGFYRVWLSGTIRVVDIYLRQASSYAGSTANYVYLGGLSLDLLGGPTSFVGYVRNTGETAITSATATEY